MDAIDRVEGLLGSPERLRAQHALGLAASVGEFCEFAALRWDVWQDRHEDLLDLFPPGESAFLEAVQGRRTGIALLDLVAKRAAQLSPIAIDGASFCEVPLGQEGWEAGGVIARFEEAFKNALVEVGVPTQSAHGLAGAFNEVASNASEHSQPPIPPVAAFTVDRSGWTFVVVDVGRGARRSLSDNPAYASLQDDLAALRAALEPGASATGQAGRGHGYSHFFKALVDRSYRLRIRSGAALARWSGASPTEHDLRWRRAAAHSGFQIAVRANTS